MVVVGVELPGINDSSKSFSDAAVERSLQRAINLVRSIGKEPLVGTFFPTIGDRASWAPIAANYSQTIRQLAISNDVKLMDFERAWQTTCTSISACQLLNLPEGLHPNRAGYRVMAEVAAAALLNIDIFSPVGTGELAGALGVPISEIVTKPQSSVP